MREVTEPPSYLLIDSADESERDSEGDLILAVKDIKQEDGATLLLCKMPKLEQVWHSYKEVALELFYLFIRNYANSVAQGNTGNTNVPVTWLAMCKLPPHPDLLPAINKYLQQVKLQPIEIKKKPKGAKKASQGK